MGFNSGFKGLKSIFILHFLLRTVLRSGPAPLGLHAKILYAFLTSPTCATNPDLLILLDFITRITFGEEYWLCNFSQCNVTSYKAGPTILTGISNQCASLTMGDHVHTQERTTEIGFAVKVLTKLKIIFNDSATRKLFTGNSNLWPNDRTNLGSWKTPRPKRPKFNR